MNSCDQRGLTHRNGVQMRLSEDRVADPSHRVSGAAWNSATRASAAAWRPRPPRAGSGGIVNHMFHSDVHLFHATQSTVIEFFSKPTDCLDEYNGTPICG